MVSLHGDIMAQDGTADIVTSQAQHISMHHQFYSIPEIHNITLQVLESLQA